MITEFKGKYNYLSNFYYAPTEFEGILYPSSEHAYQASKTKNNTIRIQISEMSAKESKNFWHKKRNEIYKRDDWNDELKVKIMKEIVLDKFTRNLFLRMKLLSTRKKELIEGNYWKDTFWGVCEGIGENHLGKILMEVREELKIKLF